MLKKGDKAPEFNLMSDSGKETSLATYKGKKLVLYFYPKDDTSGCTAEAQEFTALIADFKANGAEVVGISPDSVEKHVKFKAKHSLNVILLADTENNVSAAYGAYGEKSMYGKKYMGIIRSTFVISPDGLIEEALYKVKAKGHAGEVLCLLKK